MELKRCSGILMPISSLPGGYGIGSLGARRAGLWIFSSGRGRAYGRFCP